MHHVWKYGTADIQSASAEIRRGKKIERKNKRQDENMYGLPYYIWRTLIKFTRVHRQLKAAVYEMQNVGLTSKVQNKSKHKLLWPPCNRAGHYIFAV